MNTTDSIKEFIRKFFSSGLDEKDRGNIDRQLLEKIQTINAYSFIALTSIIITFIYYLISSPNYLNSIRIWNALADIAICLSLILYMRITRNVNAGSTVIIFFQYLLFIFGIMFTGNEGVLFIFVSLIPYLVVYLKGAIKGLKWLILFTVIYMIIIILADIKIIKTMYSIEVIGYMFLGFVNLGIFAVVSVYRIEQSTQVIKNQLKEITELSRIDYLTNVLNKRAFMEMLESERKRTIRHYSWIGKQREGISDERKEQVESEYKQAVDNIKGYLSTFSVVLMDIDHFKDINDTYGHLFGDEILKAIGEELLIKKILRENDIVGRFGGEEFILLLPETKSEQAYLVSERIRERIANRTFIYENIKSISITVSIGISEMLLSDNNSDDVIRRADRALYNAKEFGRNCTKIYEVVNR